MQRSNGAHAYDCQKKTGINRAIGHVVEAKKTSLLENLTDPHWRRTPHPENPCQLNRSMQHPLY